MEGNDLKMNHCFSCEDIPQDASDAFQEECREGRIELVTYNATQSLSARGKWSKTVETINQLPWVLAVKNISGYQIRATFSLAGTEDTTHSVYTECVVKVVSADPLNSLVGRFAHKFFRGGQGVGFESSAAHIFNPSNKFIIGNRLTVEAYIACGSLKKVFPITAPKEFSLELDFKISSATERADYFLKSEIGTDCEISVGSTPNVRQLRVCKAVLAKASPIFEQMLFGNFQEIGIIKFEDIEPEVFELVLRHIYGARWKFESRKQAAETFCAADKLMLDDLKKYCVHHLWPRSVCDTWVALELASFYNLEDLEEAAMHIVRRNAAHVFRSEKFVELSRRCVLKILWQSELDVGSELEIFDATLRWGNAQCARKGFEICSQNLRLVMGEIIQAVRFLAMSPERFAQSPCTSGVLTSEEISLIFRRLVSNDESISIPNICCFSYPRGKCTILEQ